MAGWLFDWLIELGFTWVMHWLTEILYDWLYSFEGWEGDLMMQHWP